MHFSAQEEYGLRCVLQLARNHEKEAVTAREISEKEAISLDYVHKLLGILKRKGLIQSTRGIKGGFRLKKEPSQIAVCEVLDLLCSDLNSDGHCAKFTQKKMRECVNAGKCVLKPFWDMIFRFYEVLGSKVTILDLIEKKIPSAEMNYLSLPSINKIPE
ncbi:MAG TPA: Rrf2 family transcriptional regulator [archaeon]|nr:Rrf2 family transcriptional regulator [archaeon]